MKAAQRAPVDPGHAKDSRGELAECRSQAHVQADRLPELEGGAAVTRAIRGACFSPGSHQKPN